MPSNPSAEQQETVEALLDAGKRRSKRVNVRTSFVQGGTQRNPVPGPLHGMLSAHDERALDLFLLHRALVSKEPWTNRPLDSRVWARALGLQTDADAGVAAVSKAWRRLDENYGLISRDRSGRRAVFTSLKEDGSREPYTSPDGAKRADRYFTVPFEFWTSDERWYTTLTFAAKVMLLIASTLDSGFVLPTEKAPEWYGVSTESAERGLRVLREAGLLDRATKVKSAPLSPTGKTREYRYTLVPPFGRRRRPSLHVVRAVS
jgi:hypothetical protein